MLLVEAPKPEHGPPDLTHSVPAPSPASGAHASFSLALGVVVTWPSPRYPSNRTLPLLAFPRAAPSACVFPPPCLHLPHSWMPSSLDLRITSLGRFPCLSDKSDPLATHSPGTLSASWHNSSHLPSVFSVREGVDPPLPCSQGTCTVVETLQVFVGGWVD